MTYHMTAFFLGFFLDLLVGDPYCLPHPIRLLGRLIATVEARFLGRTKEQQEQKEKREKKELAQGVWLVILILGITFLAAAGILITAYLIHPYAGVVIEGIMTYQILAVKCLKDESMKVYHCLKEQRNEDARRAVAMIVGRDTQELGGQEIAKAAIETVAENTSDGIVAPMLYTALGGPILGFLYKAVNTMDSMVGYRNEKYLYFGRAAAKLDDFVNYLPARISAYLMLAASFIGGKCYAGKGAFYIYKRDKGKHASPNSAQTESVCAGALGIQLAGDTSYFGRVVKKPYIGDAVRSVEYEDIRRTNRLMYITAWLCQILCLLGMLLIGKVWI